MSGPAGVTQLLAAYGRDDAAAFAKLFRLLYADRIVDLDAVLSELSASDERLTRVVECRFFAGLTEEETALVLGTSVRTVQRVWMRARAWLEASMGA